MTNGLEDLVYRISEEDAEMFDNVFAEFEKGASVSADEQNRIFSSVMRKAGSDMKETMVTKKTRKHGRRLFMLLVAVLIFVFGALGTTAYFFNEQGILNGMKHQFWNYKEAAEEEIELMNGMTSTKGKVIENTFEELDVSYDGVVCDGNHMFVIFTLKRKDGTPLKAPDGYKWGIGYIDENLVRLSVTEECYRSFLDIYHITENDDGSLSLKEQSSIYDQKIPLVNKVEMGLNGLYCIPTDTSEEAKELFELADNAENDHYHADDGGEGSAERFFEAMEKYSAEYYKGSFICQADPDGVTVRPKIFTAEYKGGEMTVNASPLDIDMTCTDTTIFSEEDIKYENWVKIKEERFSSIEIFYKDGTSETAVCTQSGGGGNAERYTFSFSYSTGKPIVISKIDHIVFDGETIVFDNE